MRSQIARSETTRARQGRHDLASRQALRSVPLFSELADAELDLIASTARELHYPKGHMVFSEGDQGDFILVVLAGRVKIVLIGEEGRELILTRLGPGSVFGELAVLDGAPRSATAITTEKTVFLQLKKEQLLRIVHQHPSFGTTIMRHMAGNMRETNERVRTLSMFDVYGRILRTLIGLARQHGNLENSRITLRHRPSNQELANMANCSRETVSRAMKVLQQNSYVTVTGDDLAIELRALKRYWHSN